MLDAYIYDGKRTPFGRYSGSLSSVRPDDLLGSVIKTIVDENPVNPDDIDDRMEIPPQWTGGFTPQYSNGQAGSLVALGAIGKAPPFNLPNLRWPSEAADYQGAPDEFGDLNKSQ